MAKPPSFIYALGDFCHVYLLMWCGTFGYLSEVPHFHIIVKVLFIEMCRVGLFLPNVVLKLRHLKSPKSFVCD